ncbi:MAG: ParB/RepB/Spo0J family partition protein [Deltaproteobacteria bacterium]|nr:ParB/RepB/Spo0J family partition protein [Deltaproteobacteria bacterium]
MVKKTGLGKGMAALLPVVEDEGRSYFSCPIEDIRPNRDQPRKSFAADKLDELAASIREKGIIQPLVVRKMSEHYELVAGERRWRAAQKAGLHEVPVVIQDISDDTALEMALIENIQREDLNAIEQAEAFHSLIEKFHLSQEEMAKRVGKDRSTVTNSLRLLKLPLEIKNDILEDRLSMGHARALLALESHELMEKAREEILRRHLSVRETENLVKRLKAKRTPRPKPAPGPEITSVVDSLKRRFMTRVAIRQSGRGGKIEISYSTADELTRIIDILAP